jgi:hypothetical protein
MIIRRVALGVFLCLFASSVSGAPWRFANPRPHGNNVLDMLFLDGIVWQVGERGSIYTSPDLDLWLPQESGTTNSLRSITTFDSQIFISGEEGIVLSGLNPRELTIRSLGTTDWLEGIAASSSAIVTVGDNGAIYSSSNGVDWTRRENFTTWLRSVAFGENQFVAVGEEGFIATSADGINWEQRTSGTDAHLNRVAWIDDRFWIVGDEGTVLTNSSPTSFAKVNVGITNTLFTVSGNGTEMVIAGDGIVLLGSPDGTSWTPQSDPDSPLLAPVWPYYSSIWDGRLFLLSGQTGMLVEGFRTNASAPLNWYSTIQPTRSWLWGVTHTAGLYTAVGVDGTIVTSDDGVEWDREVTPLDASASVLLGVGGNTDALIAVGNRGTMLRSENILTNLVSTNLLGDLVTNVVSLLGVNWDRITTSFSVDLQGVAATDNLILITGGNGTILTSSGLGLGTIWLPQISGVTNFLSGAAAWPGGFVVVGTAGVILTSPNGVVWTRRESSVQSWIYSVRYVGGRLIAVGEDGVILTSSDGSEWQPRTSGTSEWLNDVTFANGTWYITGSDGMLVTSSDAISWRAEKSITSKSLYGAATDGQQIIAVGMEGVILRKDFQTAITPVEILSYDHSGLRNLFLFSGQIDQRFVLEESESVTGPWRAAAFLELTDVGGTLVVEIPSDGAPTKFYRTRLL